MRGSLCVLILIIVTVLPTPQLSSSYNVPELLAPPANVLLAPPADAPSVSRLPRDQSQGSGQPQDPATWQGVAPPGGADSHEFDVSPGFDNDVLTVEITWDQALIYDLDLLLQRFDSGEWQVVGASAFPQIVVGRPYETVFAVDPVPGRYRALVWNTASTETSYWGRITFRAYEGMPQARANVDRPDTIPDPQIHSIYFVPSGAADEGLDTAGILEASVWSMNSWFRSQTGGRQLTPDTYFEDGIPRLDVSFVRGTHEAAVYSEDINVLIDELTERGFNSDTRFKHYLVYVAAVEIRLPGAAACGLAFVPRFALVLLDSHALCGSRAFGGPSTGPSYAEAIAAHELLHTLYAVPILAPHHCWTSRSHVCTAQAGLAAQNLDPEWEDIMFPVGGLPLSDRVLDKGHDDYYGHSLPIQDVQDSAFLSSR